MSSLTGGGGVVFDPALYYTSDTKKITAAIAAVQNCSNGRPTANRKAQALGLGSRADHQ